MNVVIFLTLFAVATNCLPSPNFDSFEVQFHQFIEKFNRNYESPEEYQYRLEAFKLNLKRIEEFQARETGTATFGITKFADRILEELHRPTYSDEPLKNIKIQPTISMPSNKIPSSFDWRNHNVVTPVGDEGFCMANGIFTAVGNTESQHAIKHSKLLAFSEQELIDCSQRVDSCQVDGSVFYAYYDIARIGGLELESAYPYTNEPLKCKANPNKFKVHIKNFTLFSDDDFDLVVTLNTYGPFSAVMNAMPDFAFYIGGIYNPADCNPYELNTAVLIVGYGVEKSHKGESIPYWIGKNCWGTTWGEKGYFRISRGFQTCGIEKKASGIQVA